MKAPPPGQGSPTPIPGAPDDKPALTNAGHTSVSSAQKGTTAGIVGEQQGGPIRENLSDSLDTNFAVGPVLEGPTVTIASGGVRFNHLDARQAAIVARIENAFGMKLPPGARIYWPEHDFMATKSLEAIQPTRTAEEALALLGDEPDVYGGFLRGVDGCGSSNDLPGKFREQRNEAASGLARFSSTPTFASSFEIKIKFEKARDGKNVIEYSAPQYKVNQSYAEQSRPNPNKKGAIDQKDAPNFILRLFRLSGIRVTMEDVDERALAGGMGTSGAFNHALLEFANHYSGAGLSQADLISLGVYLENDVFKGLTGGQEAISTMQGGGNLHVWLRGFRDEAGQFPNGFVSLPMPEQRLRELSEHAVLFQAGKTFKDTVPETNRYAKLTNFGWTDGIEDADPFIRGRHLDNVRLTSEYVEAFNKGDWDGMAVALNQYVKNRDQNTLRWLNVVLDYHQGHRDGLPAYVENWYRRVFVEEGNEHYEAFQAVRDLIAEHGDKIRNMSLYTFEPIATEAAAARELDMALFPLGAGGPGTLSILLAPEGLADLRRRFLDPRGLTELTRDAARRAMTEQGTHHQRGFIPYSVGMEPGGFERAELDPANGPIVIG